MKITVFHPLCGREVMVQQILGSQGHCPWDGKPFSAHYNATLAEALAAAEIAGTALQDALDRIAGMSPDMTIDEESVIGPIRGHMDRLNAERKGSPA